MNSFSRRNADLERLRQDKVCRVWLRFTLLSLLLLLCEILFLFRPVADYRGTLNAVLLAVILLAVLFFLSGAHKICFDRAWEGEVFTSNYSVRLEIEGMRTGYSKLGSGRTIQGRTYRQVNYCELYIRTDRNQTIIYTLRLPKVKAMPFKIGDRLRKYRGFAYPIIFDADVSLCIVCGSLVQQNSAVCPHCGASVVDNHTTTV